MEVLDSVACADSFPASLGLGASLGPVFRSNGGYFAVSGNDVMVQLAYGQQGSIFLTQPFHVGPGNGVLVPGTIGVMFRNYVAGQVATVSAGLAEPTEPTVQLTAAGVSTPGSSGGGMQLISFQSLLAPAPSIDFSNIVQTAKSLVLEWALRGDSAGPTVNTFLRIAAGAGFDASANYIYNTWRVNAGAGAAVTTAGGVAAGMYVGESPAAVAAGNQYGSGRATVQDYAATDKFKGCVHGSGTVDTAGLAAANYWTNSGWGSWVLNTNGWTGLQLRPSAGNWVAGSWAALWSES